MQGARRAAFGHTFSERYLRRTDLSYPRKEKDLRSGCLSVLDGILVDRSVYNV